MTRINSATRMAEQLRGTARKGCRQAAAVLLGGMMLAACSAPQEVNSAQEGIAHFHEMLTAGQFEQIYAQADEGLKKVTKSEDMTRLLSAINRKLGAVKTSQSVGWSMGYSTSIGNSMTLRYTTQFEHGSADETFLYRFADGRAQLAGYHVNSNALIAN